MVLGGSDRTRLLKASTVRPFKISPKLGGTVSVTSDIVLDATCIMVLLALLKVVDSVPCVVWGIVEEGGTVTSLLGMTDMGVLVNL